MCVHGRCTGWQATWLPLQQGKTPFEIIRFRPTFRPDSFGTANWLASFVLWLFGSMARKKFDCRCERFDSFDSVEFEGDPFLWREKCDDISNFFSPDAEMRAKFFLSRRHEWQTIGTYCFQCHHRVYLKSFPFFNQLSIHTKWSRERHDDSF